jgi:hypothetical protein
LEATGCSTRRRRLVVVAEGFIARIAPPRCI